MKRYYFKLFLKLQKANVAITYTDTHTCTQAINQYNTIRFNENSDSFKKCNPMYSQITHETQHALLTLDMITKFNKVFLRETK